MEVAKPWTEQSSKPVSAEPALGAWLYVRSWSPDGRKLAGSLWKAEGVGNGFGIYSVESGQVRLLTDIGGAPVRLADSRRLLFQDQGKLYLINSQSGRQREILSVAPHGMDTRRFPEMIG